ncbi:MAG: DUF3006 domain-containing protein [Limnochordia bacterium]|nr:DUF3006 domain-containing protein [Limnochordia bacterium]
MGTFTAVIDQISDDIAHLLVEKGGRTYNIPIPTVLLPPGAREGHVLKVTFEFDREEEVRRQNHVADLLEKLKSKQTSK